MATLTLNVNGRDHVIEDLDPETPLLWVLRDRLGLTGTKYGCGIAQCGACTVHVDGAALRSCSESVGRMAGRRIVTIEGLARSAEQLHPVQDAWIEHDVSQCGYCQPGQIMQAAALLAKNPSASQEEIRKGMSGNLCRCGTYKRIEQAVTAAAARMQGGAS